MLSTYTNDPWHESRKQSGNGNVSGIMFTSELTSNTVPSRPGKFNWKKNPCHPLKGIGNTIEYVIVVFDITVFIIFVSESQTTGCGIIFPGLLGSATSNLKSRLNIQIISIFFSTHK